jgi:3D-(3,5/4)-trihydroxycyclohexane-1,2-dione acylhydrolase (decyclizing)
MMAQEIVTAVQEGVDLKIVLVQNRGFASIGALSESLGSQRFGTAYRTQEDLAKVAEGLGATVHRAESLDDLEAALRGATGVTVVQIETDPLVSAPDSEAWWDVPVAEVSGLDSTRSARETYDENKQTQQQYLNPRERVTP